MNSLPNKDKLILNFSRCTNWEEKYLYIIELGEYLPLPPIDILNSKYFIKGCQNQVWIIVTFDKNNNRVKLYGDSDSVIIKGIIAIIFILYHNMTPEEIINYDILPFFDNLSLTQYLTPSRVQGIEAILQGIHFQILANSN